MSINKTKMNEIFGNLDKTLPVAILIHNFPDPDALGAAAGFSVLLKEVYSLNSKLFHFGAITHPQNKTLKNLLHIRLEDAKTFDAGNASAVVVVDSDLINTGLRNKVAKVDVRIDHHSTERDDIVPALSDVRIIGSACSIVYEYLSAFEIDLAKHIEIATALVLGIKTDTADFTSENTTVADIDAFRLLLPIADKELMAKINKFPLPKYSFEVEAKAFKEREQTDNALVSYVGDVSSHRDIIATIADKFIRIDGVKITMIMGLVDNTLVASLRNEDSRWELGELIARIFGKENGGAKGYSGGASIDLGSGFSLLTDKIRDQAISSIVESFKQKLFESVGEKQADEKEEENK